jgi:hypothetical protein
MIETYLQSTHRRKQLGILSPFWLACGEPIQSRGVRNKFYLLLKVTEVKVQNVTISRHVSLLFNLEYSNIVLIRSVHISTKF